MLKNDIHDLPLLSIIVPNYNNETYLKTCIESILTQTYKYSEIIISDDASSDKSVEIIKRYENLYNEKIKGLYHEDNRGVSFSRHSAILEAKGKYITTLDSDDYYYDDEKLEKEMDIILFHRKNSGKNVCAFSNIVKVSKDQEPLQVVGTSNNIREGNIFDGVIARDCFIPRDFILPKTAYFEVGGFDQTLHIYEDWDLKIRLAAKYEFYFSGINGVAYRQHGGGLSSCSLPKHIEVLEEVFKKNIKLTQEVYKQDLSDRFRVFISELKNQEVHESKNTSSLFTMFRNRLKFLIP